MKRELIYAAVVGGYVGALMTMMLSWSLPIGAPKGDATFGEITCTKLNVVNAEGDTKVSIDIDTYGGSVHVRGMEGGWVSLFTRERGGVVSVVDKGGLDSLIGKGNYVELYNNRYGGYVLVSGKDGKVELTPGARDGVRAW